MESFSERANYDKVAGNINNNIESINKILNSCSLHSKVVDQEENINEFLSVDVDNLIKDQPKTDYYDLSEISKIFDTLGTSKQDTKKKSKLLSSEFKSSLLSLTSITSSTLSLDDISPAHDYKHEVLSHLTEIRSVLLGISNTYIKTPDLSAIAKVETAKSNSFVELFAKLQKLLKELQSIASTDSFIGEETLKIDDQLITDLNRLSKVSVTYVEILNYFSMLLLFPVAFE